MFYSIPPFKPRAPLPHTPVKSKSLRRVDIFPYLRRFPNTNAQCARFRLKRNEEERRILQRQQLKALKEIVNTTRTTIEQQRHAFAELAAIHNITVSIASSLEDLQCGISIIRPISRPSALPPSSLDVQVQRHSIHQIGQRLEMTSRPTSPSPSPMTASLTKPCISVLPTPSPMDTSLPLVTATFHRAPLRGPGYFIAEAYHHLQLSFKSRPRRHRNQPRARRRKH